MNVRNLLAVSALAAGLAIVPSAASAAPSILGPTGYILTPNAQVVGPNCVDVGWDHVDYEVLDLGLRQGALRFPDVNYYKANLGLFDRLEIGGNFIHVNGHGTADTAMLNLKGTVFPRTSPFQLAGGVIDALDSVDRGEYVVGQFNAGQVFEAPFLPRSLQIGAGYIFDIPLVPLGGGSGLVHPESIFVNGGFMIGQYLELMGEWFEDSEMVNVGGRIHVPASILGGLSLNVYALDVTDKTILDGTVWSFGVSYTQCFGGKKKHHEEEDEKGKDDKGDYVEPEKGKEVVPAPVQKSSNLRSKLAANLLRAQ